MIIKTGQAITVLFATADPTTGAATDADALPVGTLYVNGVADAAVVTVANIAIGIYKASLTLPGLATGDLVALRIAATMTGVAGEAIVWQAVADTARVSEVKADTAEIGVAGAGLTALGDARLANLDAMVSSRATPSDVAVSLAVSAMEAAAVASGTMALTLYGSFDQTIESNTGQDLSSADALIWAVKTDRKRDEDAEALVLVDMATGLRYLARAAYTGAAANGSITLGGSVGAWEIRCQLAAGITGELAQWANRGLDAQIKAIFGDRTVNVWEGTARINHQTIREV